MTLTLLDNRYQIIRALGSGGFGDTFLAEDTHMPSGRRCVIKQLKPVNNDPQVYQLVQDRFRREAAILEELGDANNQIPRLYAYFESAGQFYLVQEWIAGETLGNKVQQQGVLSESFAKEILVGILPVLDYVHSKRIVHRDIKPDNIILRSSDGKPVLIDFGAVKETMGTIVTTGGNSGRSIAIGTPGFMPSEQSAGRPVYSSDLYSLGLTTIYLLTGKLPQQIETDYGTGEMLWRQHALNVSPTFAAILDKAIQSHPRDRYSTPRVMLDALQSGTVPIAPTVPFNQPTVASGPRSEASYQPPTVASGPLGGAFYQPPTVASPPPVNVAYQPPIGGYSEPAPTSRSTNGMGDWQKAVIIGSAIGAVVVVGLIVTRPPTPPPAQSTSQQQGSVNPPDSNQSPPPAQSSSQQQGSVNPPDSNQSPPPAQSISQQEATDVINSWIRAKRELFAPPFNRQLGAEITTGKAYQENIGSGSSLEWLENNNAYYQYGVQRIDSVERFEANGNDATIEVVVTEERTLYKDGKIDRENTALDTRLVRYTLRSDNDKWKIAAYKTIQVLRKS